MKAASLCQGFYLFQNSIDQDYYNLKVDSLSFSLGVNEVTWGMYNLIADVFKYTSNTDRLVPYLISYLKDHKVSWGQLRKNGKLKRYAILQPVIWGPCFVLF